MITSWKVTFATEIDKSITAVALSFFFAATAGQVYARTYAARGLRILTYAKCAPRINFNTEAVAIILSMENGKLNVLGEK